MERTDGRTAQGNGKACTIFVWNENHMVIYHMIIMMNC